MKAFHFPVLVLLPLLLVSCGKKSAEKTSESSAAEASAEGIVLAKKHFLPPVGTVVTKVSTMDMKDAVMKVQAGPRDIQGTASQTSSGEETVEVISPTRIRRLVISKKSGGKMTVDGNEQPTGDKTDPLEGQPVILELKDGAWTAALESGAEASAEQRENLDKMVKEISRGSDFQMYGDTPRKVGDKWDVDPSKLANFGDAEKMTGTYSVEFVSTGDFQGTECAVLKAIFDIKGKTPTEGDAPPMDMSFKGTAVAKRSIKDMLDLDVAVDGTMAVSGSPNPGVKLEVTGPAHITEKNSLQKK